MTKNVELIDNVYYEYSIINKCVKIYSCSCDEKVEVLKIPSFIFSFPVKMIGEKFWQNSNVKCKKVIISENVEKIYNRAFFNAETIEYIFIPKSVNSIGESCFKSCVLLKKVEIEDDSLIKIIPKNCFNNCVSLEELKCQLKLEKIESDAFNKCDKLKLFIDNILTTSDDFYLYYSTNNNTIDFAFLQNSDNFIKEEKSSLINVSDKKVTIKDKINNFYFEIYEDFAIITDIDNVSEKVIFPDTICYHDKEYYVKGIYISHCVESDCKTINFLKLPNKLQYIKGMAFSNFKMKCPIEVPSSVEMFSFDFFGEIYYYVFFHEGIKAVELIGDCFVENPLIFENIAKLKNQLLNFCNVYSNISIDKICIKDNCVCLITDDGIKCLRYLDDSILEMPILNNIVVNNQHINGILPYCFCKCLNLKKVFIDKYIETIGEHAFDKQINDNNYIDELIFEENSNLKAIGECAFFFQKMYMEFKVPDSVVYLADNAILNSGDLKFIFSKNSKIEYIGSRLLEFYDYTDLFFPKSVKVICSNYIRNENCSITFDKNCEPIFIELINYTIKYTQDGDGCYLGSPDNNFLVLNNLKNIGTPYIKVSSSTKCINKKAFEGCSNLMAIDFQEGLISISSSLPYCTSVIINNLPKSLKYIYKGFLENVQLNCHLNENIIIFSKVEEIYKKPRWI